MLEVRLIILYHKMFELVLAMYDAACADHITADLSAVCFARMVIPSISC